MASVMQPLRALQAGDLGARLDSLAAGAGASPGGEARWWLRARYEGQGHELDVPVTPGEEGAAIGARFAELHAARFGFTLERHVEIVSARCAVTGVARLLRLTRRANSAVPWDASRPHDAGGPLDARVRGPATISLPDATLLVKPGWEARSLELGGWLLEREVE
jgi:N-methylhydantoinase A